MAQGPAGSKPQSMTAVLGIWGWLPAASRPVGKQKGKWAHAEEKGGDSPVVAIRFLEKCSPLIGAWPCGPDTLLSPPDTTGLRSEASV